MAHEEEGQGLNQPSLRITIGKAMATGGLNCQSPLEKQFAMYTPHYRRADQEGRTLLQSEPASAADLQLTETDLRVSLAAQSSPHRTRAVAARCNQLNQFKALFPGSRLCLHPAVREAS